MESLGEEKDVNEKTLHSNNAEDEVLEWSVILESNGTNINYKLDTGVKLIFFQKRNTLNSSTNLSYIQQK